MKPKKNPKADLSKIALLFFQIGLVFVLFIAWQLIEMKSYTENDLTPKPVEYATLWEKDVPIVVIPDTKLPVAVPKTPEVKEPTPDIVIVPDDKKIEKKPTEKPKEEEHKIVKVSDIPTIEVDEPVSYSFTVVENVPVFPGCEKYDTNEERKQCMSAKVRAFVNQNFDTDLAQELGLSGTTRIQVIFKIDGKGEVVDVKARASHPRLQQEAVQVVEGLPDMEPGKQRGKPVEVLYSLPIIFQVR